jgi:tetratricopeptide (TPR) repeat protein
LPEESNDVSLVHLYLNSGQPGPARAALESDPVDTQFVYRPAALHSGLIWRLEGDSARAVHAFDSARVELEALVEEDPMEARYRTSLGLALAGIGRYAEAIREGEEGVRLMSPEVEAWRGTYRVSDLAQIYAMTGRTDEAIEQLDYLMSIPSEVSPATLRLNPAWDSLREDARFRALVTE